MTQRKGEQGRGVGGMSVRAAAWLAWSLVVLSVVFVLSGFILARTTHSVDSTLPYGGADDGMILTLVTVLAFSVVGAVVASAILAMP